MRSSFALSAFVAAATAQYELQSTFAGETFFDNFVFYNSWDPTLGFVHYVAQDVAEQYGMINVTNTTVSWGVDTTQTLNPNANLGRLSTRLYSIQSWTHGLFVVDLAHMPANVCGTWPAFWALGSGTWPDNGEIDIIEYTNNVPNNLMALHTTPGCTVAGADETGTLLSSDCGLNGGITGCTVASTAPNNSGADFNANGGGVYTMEWTSTAIRIWFFPRTAIPASIATNAPDTDEFGTPAATFEGSCAIDQHFYNMSLLFDIDFCGEYAGNVWQADGCPMLDAENSWSSCNEFVALSPGAFVESYWAVNYLQVYQTPDGAAPPTPSPVSSVTSAISTSAVSTALSNAVGRSTSFTMSLAGTVPSITTGSFTATSSVLSVLSSLSSKSAALRMSTNTSASNEITPVITASSSTSDNSATTAPTTLPSITPAVVTPTATTPTAVIPTAITPAATTPAAVPPTVTTTPPTSTTSSLPTPLPCEGNVCTSITYAVVVQTVTVTIADEVKLDRRSNTLGAFACDFTIPPKILSKYHTTDFACTSTREEIFNGTLYTETLTASTSIRSGQILQFFTYLEIDNISIETKCTQSLACPRQYTYTGNFRPSVPYIGSTMLTAYPLTTGLTVMPPTRPSLYWLPAPTFPVQPDVVVRGINALEELKGSITATLDLAAMSTANANHSPATTMNETASAGGSSTVYPLMSFSESTTIFETSSAGPNPLQSTSVGHLSLKGATASTASLRFSSALLELGVAAVAVLMLVL